jgi:hypothetical protein
MIGVRSDPEAGLALIVCLGVVIALSAIGVGLVAATSTERLIAANARRGVVSEFAAASAIDGVLTEVAAMPSWSPLVSGAVQSSFRGVSRQAILPSGGALDLDRATAELQAGTNAAVAPGLDTPVWRLFAWGRLSDLAGLPASPDLPFVAVWAADDEADGDRDAGADANGVVQLHAAAFGAGASRAMADARVGRTAAGVHVLSWRVG